MQIRGASVWEIRLRQEGAPADGRGGGGAPALDERRQAARKQRCAIYNGVWYHLDVMAGLAWAFQEAGCRTDLFMHKRSRGLEGVMEGWFRGRQLPMEQLYDDQAQYDLVIMVTFPESGAGLAEQMDLLLARRPGQRFLLTVHNPGWLLEAAGPLAPLLLLAQDGAAPPARRPVQLLSLAPCGATYSRSLAQSWVAAMRRWLPGQSPAAPAPEVEVPWIVPLVPWEPPASKDAADEEAPADGGGGNSTNSTKAARRQREGAAAAAAPPLRHLCIQGNLDPARRNYAAAFAAAGHPAVVGQLRERDERLLLVGSDQGRKLEVPPALKEYVEPRLDLDYEEYYETLSRCRALLTAFGSEVYLINKTSSTVAAALQVGTPLVTEERVLGAYEYVPPSAAFLYAAQQGPAPPDAAALAADVGAALSGELQRAAGVAAPAGSRGRRLIEGQLQAWAQRLAELAAEDEGEEDHGLEATEDWEQRRAARRGQKAQRQAAAEQREEQQQQRARRRLQAGGKAKAPPAVEAPPAGSYAAALLQAFDDGASRAAHAAAWQAKEAAMQRNVETARQLLRETAAFAAAAG